MNDDLAAIRTQLARQVTHWTLAAADLEDLSKLASPVGWRSLERYLGIAIEGVLRETVGRLTRQGTALQAELGSTETLPELERLRGQIIAFRNRYMAAEAVLDFYGDAINSRSNETLGTYLRACDALAFRSMAALMAPLGRKPPPVLTYVDKGLGASILKAGLRLWDGRSLSPVAAIKVVRHNLQRPTALIHETGHQVAHNLGWNEELAAVLRRGLEQRSSDLADAWASWASEIAADAFAFAHTGYASVAALHDVLSGGPEWVVRYLPGDPHPVSYIRILLGRAMCTRFYGAGPWDALGRAWIRMHPLRDAPSSVGQMLEASVPALAEIVDLIFNKPMRAFAGRPLASVLDPGRVKPEALADLERAAGPALYVSDYWVGGECLRLLALSGLRAATEPDRAREILQQQEGWMQRLGGLAAAA